MLHSPALRILALTGALAACSGPAEDISSWAHACHIGSYAMEDGGIIDVGASSETHLRWRTLDGQVGRIEAGDDGLWSGTTGWSDLPDPARFELGTCEDGTIRVTGVEGSDSNKGTGTRLNFTSEEIRIDGADVELAGRLVWPEGVERAPLAVLVHGSENYSALDYASLQRLLPAQGIAAFVYDKRGTGGSTGDYTQDFDLLAADAAAAHAAALALAGERITASGYLGGSQGGWVAPLAATLSEPDFVIASFGLAESPLAEDREQVQMELREAGYGADVLAQALEVTNATGRLLASDFSEGHEELERVKAAYGDEPWFNELEGEITRDMIIRPLWQFRMGYAFLGVGTSWGHDPVPVLRQVEAPMLWVLAGADREAPSANTRTILTALQAEGRAIDVAYFPNTDHGIVRFIEDESGTRQTLGYAEGYFELLADWIRTGGFEGAYGDAELAARE